MAARRPKQLSSNRLDYFVTGSSNGGALTGVGEMIKLARPEIEVIATESETAQLMTGKEWTPHRITGWTPDFIPGVMNFDIADEVIPVTDDESRGTARDLA